MFLSSRSLNQIVHYGIPVHQSILNRSLYATTYAQGAIVLSVHVTYLLAGISLSSHTTNFHVCMFVSSASAATRTYLIQGATCSYAYIGVGDQIIESSQKKKKHLVYVFLKFYGSRIFRKNREGEIKKSVMNFLSSTFCQYLELPVFLIFFFVSDNTYITKLCHIQYCQLPQLHSILYMYNTILNSCGRNYRDKILMVID